MIMQKPKRSVSQKVGSHGKRYLEIIKKCGIDAYRIALEAENHTLKILWIILAILLSVLFVVHVVKTINDAVHRESNSKVSYPALQNLEQLSDNLTIKVMICPQYGSFLNMQKLKSSNFTAAQIDYLFQSFPFNVPALHETNHQSLQDIMNHSLTKVTQSNDAHSLYQRFIEPLLQSDRSANESDREQELHKFFEQYRLMVAEIFLACYDNNRQEINCSELFQPIYHVQHGMCFETNRMPPFGIDRTVSNFAFVIDYSLIRMETIEEFIGQPFQTAYAIEIREKKSNVIMYISESGGVEQAPLPFSSNPLSYSNYKFAISAIEIQDDDKKSSCLPVDSKESKLDHFRDYNFVNCIWESEYYEMPAFGLHVNCTLPLFYLTKPNFNSQNLPICSREQMDALKISQYEENLRRFQIGNRNPCPSLCHRLEISSEILIEQDGENKDMKLVIIQHAADFYQLIAQNNAIGWSDWLSLIGGTMGLWLGCSLVSFIYIIVHFCADISTSFYS